MKKTFVLFALLLISNLLAFSQPTVTYSAACPVFGDVYTKYICDTNGISPGPSGSAQIWDFSNLVITTNTTSDTVFNPAASPYYTYFPTADYATGSLSQGGSPETFFSEYSTTEAINLGYYIDMGANSYHLAYTDPMKVMEFPFSYSDSFTDVATGTYIMSSMNCVVTQTSTITADGYGTLILPGNTYNNVLRIKVETQNTTDMGGVLTAYFNGTTYSWWDGVHKNYVFFTGNNRTILVNDTTYSKNVFISDFASGIKDVQNIEYASIYPNPASNKISIDFANRNAGDVIIKINDITGKEIQSYKFYSVSEEIDIELRDISEGIYIVTAVSDLGTMTKRLIVN